MAAARVVCISRTLAAGGEEIGRGVAERLGFRTIDAEIIQRAAEKAGVDSKRVEDAEQRQPLIKRLIAAIAYPDLPADVPYQYYAAFPEAALAVGEPLEYRLRGLIREVIEEMAAEGEVVIVAHAASMALAGREGVLRVLVTASPATRAQRIIEASGGGTKPRQAEASVRDSDRGRADYFKRFYELDQELPTHYDLIVNTDALRPEQAVGLIVAAAEA